MRNQAAWSSTIQQAFTSQSSSELAIRHSQLAQQQPLFPASSTFKNFISCYSRQHPSTSTTCNSAFREGLWKDDTISPHTWNNHVSLPEGPVFPWKTFLMLKQWGRNWQIPPSTKKRYVISRFTNWLLGTINFNLKKNVSHVDSDIASPGLLLWACC